MLQYILLAVILIIAIILSLYRLISYLMKRQNITEPQANEPETGSIETNPSIIITDEMGSRKSTAYNLQGQDDQTQIQAPSRQPWLPRVVSNGTSIDSLRSRNSFGFVPSIRSVAPVSNRGKRGTQNFLLLLDSLEPLEDDAARRRRQPKHPFTAASSSGIEANSSDETASQTFIGRDFDSSNDPGGIQLNYIKAQNKE